MLNHPLTVSVALLSLSSLSSAAYIIQDNYSPSNFFSMFNFYTGPDPTNGYVAYVSQSTAQSKGLISTTGSSVYVGVDHTNVASGSGRSSVRLESKKQYTHGLFILDLSHMPAPACGAWPAFWTCGPNWPYNGEIDILEGINMQGTNFMTLHTSSGCTMSNSGYTGKQATTQCGPSGDNSGCSIHDTRTSSYGAGFNNGKGGVFATEWTSNAIKIWFFPRSSIPSDITNGKPKPSGWGSPVAAFNGGSNCNIDSHFAKHTIVFDTTFCGSWAGNQDVWNADSTCHAKAANCQAYVQNNPSAFQNVYWTINSLKTYQDNGSGGTKREAEAEAEAQAGAAVLEGSADTVSTPEARDMTARSAKSPFFAVSPNDPGNATFDFSTYTRYLQPGHASDVDAGRHNTAQKRGLLEVLGWA